MLAAATLLYCLFLFGANQNLFRDSDAGWHVRAGQQILQQRTLPASDPYSFSKPRQPWFAWEWASDVAVALAYNAGGLTGVTALFAVAIACVSWLWTRFQFAIGGDFFLTGVFAPLMVTVAGAHWLARPHIFSWILLLGLLLYLESVAQGRRATGTIAPLATIAAFTAVWANLHASFFLAPCLCLLYAAGQALHALVFDSADTAQRRAQSRWFFWLALASLAGSLINPYGWRLHQHVASYLLDGRLTAQIAEFQSFNFHDKEGIPFALVIALSALAAVLALTQKKLTHFFLASILVWAALRSARMLPLLALIGLPLANAAIVEALRNARALRASLRRHLDNALAYSSRLQHIDRTLDGRLFLAIVTPLLLVCLAAPAFAKHTGFPADAFPVAASSAVATLPANARILSTDSFGGYLIYRFAGARQVFFDGRSDFYGADFLQQYGALTDLRPGWRKIVASYRFTHALLPRQSALAAALEREGWPVLYQDRVATLLEARHAGGEVDQ